jgi:hypothetical protein
VRESTKNGFWVKPEIDANLGRYYEHFINNSEQFAKAARYH